MGLYHPLGDFAINFPAKLRDMHAAYLEDCFDSENMRKPVKIRNTKSRNAAVRSARQNAATKKMHFLERQIFDSPIPPGKKQTLVLPIVWESEIFAYAKTDIGEFCLEWNHRRMEWRASWFGKYAWNPNPFKALAKLLGQEWGINILTGQKLSLYSLFAKIHFDFGQKANIRNRTRKIQTPPKEFRMIWQTTPKMPQNPAWTPPASPPKKLRIVFADGMSGEKSLI